VTGNWNGNWRIWEAGQAIDLPLEMSTVLIIIILIVLLGGGGYYGYNRWGSAGPGGGFGPGNLIGLLVLVLIIILIIWLVQGSGLVHFH
jgi:hypothetical protein